MEEKQEGPKFISELDQAKLETATMRIEAAQIQLDKFRLAKQSMLYELFVRYGLKLDEHQLNDITGEIVTLKPEVQIQA